MKKKILAATLLIVYGIFLVKLLVFKDMPLIRVGVLRLNFGGTHEGPANLIPFRTIFPYLLGEKGWIIAGINLVGNIVLLVPIGLLVGFVFRNMTWKKAIWLAIAAGMVIEGMQTLLHVGIFDIDDVILNGLGVLIGFGLYTIFPKPVQPMGKRNILVAAIAGIIGIAILYSVFIYQKSPVSIGFEAAVENGQPAQLDQGTGKVVAGDDPCNGTGGTGQIIGTGNKTITIRRKDGVVQLIHFTEQTTIRNAAGPVPASYLKTGVRVTLVVGEDQDGKTVASHILICLTPG